MISCYGLVFARLATVCRPTSVCLGSGHPEVYTIFNNTLKLIINSSLFYQNKYTLFDQVCPKNFTFFNLLICSANQINCLI